MASLGTDTAGSSAAGGATSARAVVRDVLSEADRSGTYPSRLLGTRLEAMACTPAVRGMATELLLGVLRHRLTIEHLVSSVAGRLWGRIDRALRPVLLVAVYEIIWLEQVEEYAVVHEAVEAAKRTAGRRGGGFVNAVLRQVQRLVVKRRAPLGEADPRRAVPVDALTACLLREPLWPSPKDDLIGWLSGAFSCPKVLVRRWVGNLGPAAAKQCCEAAISRPPVVLRPNRLRCSAERLADALVREGIDAVADATTGLVFCRSASGLTRTEPFRAGWCQPQDATPYAAWLVRPPAPGSVVLDLCAGAGTKATQAAEMMNDEGVVIATDIDENRLRELERNAQRLGLGSIRVVGLGDLERCLAEFERLDTILVDVPCTNTGVLARRPEARYRFNRARLREMAQTQAALLDRAAALARAETAILYSTCSLEPEENRRVVVQFTRRHREWVMAGDRLALPNVGQVVTEWRDGGYTALLMRP